MKQKEKLDLLAKISRTCQRMQKSPVSFPPLSEEYLGLGVHGQHLPGSNDKRAPRHWQEIGQEVVKLSPM